MKLIKKLFIVIVLTFTVFNFTNNFNVYASAASISVSASSVEKNKPVTITITVSNVNTVALNASISGAGVNSSIQLVDGSMTGDLKNFSKSVTVTPTTTGTISVSIASSSNAVREGAYVDVTGSRSITVIEPIVTPPTNNAQSNTTNNNSSSNSNSSSVNNNSSSTNNSSSVNNNSSSNTTVTTEEKPVETPKSSNNNLASLTINSGELSPAFSADVTEYNVVLPADSTSVVLEASAADSKAKVSGLGEKNVSFGRNELVITVTAENGTTKNYKVIVNVDETPTVYTEVGGNNLGVVKNLSEIAVPDGFESSTATIDGNEVSAWTNPSMNKTIVYLQNEAGEKGFYLFENNEVVSVFRPTSILGHNIFLVDLNETQQKLDGLTYSEVTIDGQTFMGFVFDDPAFANYSVIYVMDEQGQMVYYQHESTQNTLQLYANGAPVSRDAFNKLNLELKESKNKTTVLMIVSGVSILMAITSVCYIFILNKRK